VAQLYGYLVLGNVYKLRALLEDIVDGLNRHRFMIVAGATRTLIENVAVVHQLATKDIKIIDSVTSLHAKAIAHALRAASPRRRAGGNASEIGAATAAMTGWRKLLLAAQKQLRTQIQLRKANVFDGGGAVPRELQATNIMTLIDNKFRYKHAEITPAVSYHALCEFVHPNGASYGLFVDKADRKGVTRELRLAAQPNDLSLQIVALQLIATPVVECVPAAVETLGAMKARWLALEKLEKSFRHYSRL
jgi:hypothetical protein